MPKKEYPNDPARKQAKRLRAIVRKAKPTNLKEAEKILFKSIPKAGLKKGNGEKLRSFLDTTYKK